MKNITLLKGQSLIEAMVVVGVVVLLVTGLVSVTTATVKFTQMSKTRTQALHYAKEAMEVVRIVKETDWNLLPQTSAHYCLARNERMFSTQTDPCPENVDSYFKRSIDFSSTATCTSPDCRFVTVKVAWNELNKEKSVTLTSIMTNWRTQQ